MVGKTESERERESLWRNAHRNRTNSFSESFNGLFRISEFPVLLFRVLLIQIIQSWHRRHSPVSLCYLIIITDPVIWWAHSHVSASALEAEARRKLSPELLIITWSWWRQLPRLHPAATEGGYSGHRDTLVTRGAGCSHRSGVWPQRREWSLIIFCNLYWGITEWRNVRGWIIFMNHWMMNNISTVSCPTGWDIWCKMYCCGKIVSWIMTEWV